MKSVQIQAKPFFELLQQNEQSMWSIFNQMIDGEEKDIIFLDEENKVLFNFILPKTQTELTEKQAEFTELFKQKLKDILEKN